MAFLETFDAAATERWPTGEYDNDLGTLQLEIADGVYRWHVGSWANLHRSLANQAVVKDFVLSVDARLADGSHETSYGLAFRVLDSSNYYFFTLSEARGFALFRKYQGKWTGLTEWQDTFSIRPGARNRIAMVAVGPEFTFYINDQLVDTIVDNTLAKGRVGLAIDVYEADQQVVFEFDNLELRQLVEQAAPITTKVIAVGNPIRSMAISPDGSIVAVAGKERGLQLWNTGTQQLETDWSDRVDRVNDLAFSPDGTILAAAGDDDVITLWDVSHNKLLDRLQGHTLWVNGVAFSPDGETLASASADRTVRLWQVSTGQELRVLSGHTDWVRSVAMSPQGDLLAAGSCHELEEPGSSECTMGEIVLWHAGTGEMQHAMLGHQGWVRCLAFSPDGQMLASGSNDGTIYLWDTTTGQQIAALQGHSGWVNGLTFAPDGAILASASDDKLILLWDPATGQEIDSLPDHSSWIIGAAFTADGSVLASADEDGNVILWPSTMMRE